MKGELHRFWKVYAKDDQGHVPKAEYLRVHSKFCLVLIPDITFEEAVRPRRPPTRLPPARHARSCPPATCPPPEVLLPAAPPQPQ